MGRILFPSESSAPGTAPPGMVTTRPGGAPSDPYANQIDLEHRSPDNIEYSKFPETWPRSRTILLLNAAGLSTTAHTVVSIGFWSAAAISDAASFTGVMQTNRPSSVFPRVMGRMQGVTLVRFSSSSWVRLVGATAGNPLLS